MRPEERAPEKAPLASGGGGDEDECPICLEPLAEGTALTLPCSHRFYPGCVEGLRSYEVKQVCPMSREELPPGAGAAVFGRAPTTCSSELSHGAGQGSVGFDDGGAAAGGVTRRKSGGWLRSRGMLRWPCF